VQRIPGDICKRAIGQKLHLPMGDATVTLVIRPRTNAVKVSLRTTDPVEAKRRQAAVASYVETAWQALRDDAPLPLTHRQATALAGRVYKAWAEGESRELTVSVTLSISAKRRSSVQEVSSRQHQLAISSSRSARRGTFSDRCKGSRIGSPSSLAPLAADPHEGIGTSLPEDPGSALLVCTGLER
jgi:hypothetical protein